MPRPRILLADDHSLILGGIRALLEPRFDIAGEAADGRALIELALRLVPDLIILDVTMPLLNGIEAARQIRARRPSARMLFLTMHADPFYLREALQAGASGYVLKSSASQELLQAVDRVLEGGTYISAAFPPELRETSLGPARDATLTDRQREVLQLVAEGRGNKEIAALLGISVKTVEFHRGQLMRILGVHTTAELTRFAIRLGLIGH